MGFDKFINKAKNLANDPKVREKLNNPKVEKFSDQVLDKAAGAADSLTKGKYSDKIKSARDAADRAIGHDDQRPGDARPGDPRTGDVRPGDARPGDPRPGEQNPVDFRDRRDPEDPQSPRR
ncbi:MULTISPECIES: antitoxin [Brevibacterium]|uniref:Antitoxin n=1 Tax=Brevibacterium casei TaxID=33889 RepID=A0A7T4DIA8_9MICO|nr:antitoxin [Brevibacterium casei]QQB14135.1 antitoxin [Brevibacterium casei]